MSPLPKLHGESSASPSMGNRMLSRASPYTCRINKALSSTRKIHFKATTAPAVRTPSWMHTSNLIVSCAPALTRQALRLQSLPRLNVFCRRLRSPRRRHLPQLRASRTAWRCCNISPTRRVLRNYSSYSYIWIRVDGSTRAFPSALLSALRSVSLPFLKTVCCLDSGSQNDPQMATKTDPKWSEKCSRSVS